MKHYFYFVRDFYKCSPQSVVYTVSVGDGKRDQVKHELVRQYASDCGFYYKKVDCVSDIAIDNLANRLFSGCLWPRLRLRRAKIGISDLYSMIIDDTFDTFESHLSSTKAHFHILNALDISFRLQNNKINSNTLLPSVRRKNLKSSERDSRGQAIIGFCLILVLYVVASLICSTEVYY